MLRESIKKVSDDKIDNFIKKEWATSASTYTYDNEGVYELGKVLKDVLISPDKQFAHIPGELDSETSVKVQKIINKYKMVNVDTPKYQQKRGR